MSLFVIDDHPLMREAVAMLLRRVRPASKVVEMDRLGMVEHFMRQNNDPPELICLDLKLPDALGVSGIVGLRGRFPDVPIAVISAAPASENDEACLEVGADVYIEKSAGAQEIGSALRALLNPDDAADEPLPGPQKLSKRQKQLVLMLDQGMSNRDIAKELDISEHTVKVHLWRLFRRIGVKSRTQALHYARTHGLLT